jgi:hypothetical protein
MSRNPYPAPQPTPSGSAAASLAGQVLLDPVLRIAIALVMLGIGGSALVITATDWAYARETFPTDLGQVITIFVGLTLTSLLLLARSRFVFIPFIGYWAVFVWVAVHEDKRDDWLDDAFICVVQVAILLVLLKLRARGRLR